MDEEMVDKLKQVVNEMLIESGVSGEEYVSVLWGLLISWYQEDESGKFETYEEYMTMIVGRMVSGLVMMCGVWR